MSLSQIGGSWIMELNHKVPSRKSAAQLQRVRQGSWHLTAAGQITKTPPAESHLISEMSITKQDIKLFSRLSGHQPIICRKSCDSFSELELKKYWISLNQSSYLKDCFSQCTQRHLLTPTGSLSARSLSLESEGTIPPL